MIRKLWRNTRGQDLIEYALLAAFFAVAVGALSPSVATGISTIWSRVSCGIALAIAAGGG